MNMTFHNLREAFFMTFLKITVNLMWTLTVYNFVSLYFFKSMLL